MNEKIEQLGYKLLLVGPQVDFYLLLFAKIILGEIKPSYILWANKSNWSALYAKHVAVSVDSCPMLWS